MENPPPNLTNGSLWKPLFLSILCIGVICGVYSIIIYPVLNFLDSDQSSPPNVSFNCLFIFYWDFDRDRLFLLLFLFTDFDLDLDLDLLLLVLISFRDLLLDFLSDFLESDLFSFKEFFLLYEGN